jgi:hypothetical protein
MPTIFAQFFRLEIPLAVNRKIAPKTAVVTKMRIPSPPRIALPMSASSRPLIPRMAEPKRKMMRKMTAAAISSQPTI